MTPNFFQSEDAKKRAALWPFLCASLTQSLAGVIFSTLLSVNKYTFGNHSFVIERGIEETSKGSNWDPGLQPSSYCTLQPSLPRNLQTRRRSRIGHLRRRRRTDSYLALTSSSPQSVKESRVKSITTPLSEGVSPFPLLTFFLHYPLTEFRY